MKRGFSILAIVTALLLSFGLYAALVIAPTERTMGDVQRISYYHVPSAWTAFLQFIINFVASLLYLIRKNIKADILAQVSAEVGVVFCTVVLVTLLLWLIYVSYLVLRRFSTSGQTPVLAAVLAVFGAIDVPLVYFSIWFFRTQHPSPVIGGGGSLDPGMGRVLLINWAAFLCLAWLVCWTRYRLEVFKREVDEAHALQLLPEVSR